jgi:uncharacterized protein (TIGR02246 family)
MNDIRILGAMLMATVFALPGVVVGQSNVGGAATDVKNEKVVRDMYKAFVDAWNRHDFEALANMYSIDGDHIEPDGDHADGRAAVALLLKRQHEGVFEKTHLMLNIADIWFVTREVALVDGGYAISGIQTPDGKEIPERRGHLTSVLLFEDGKWWIVASRLMVPTELPYKP